jgi:hypothetical protein
MMQGSTIDIAISASANRHRRVAGATFGAVTWRRCTACAEEAAEALRALNAGDAKTSCWWSAHRRDRAAR